MSNPSQYFICALKCNELSPFSPWKLLSCWDWPSSSLKNQNSSFAVNVSGWFLLQAFVSN